MNNGFHKFACSCGDCEKELRANGITVVGSDLPDLDL